MRFVDTNILLYRISTDPTEAKKQAVSTALLAADDLGLSVQVFQEFYVQAMRPSRPDALLHEEAVALIRSWKRYPVQATNIELVEAALAAKDRWQLSYWDAAIIEAARMLGCEQLLSEDLNHGQDFDGILVVNPFID
ncbi:PIN domain-containing protein [Coraliomargarita parva]|uniref:PIN domain-containing protein n=1 Tax=Coraliomargarita parva TaxID=3014050 RepID=UPI0022B3419D|nr:PIN domain-containing protein [Coraliomargarita parva]